jgi:hypothetical protein
VTNLEEWENQLLQIDLAVAKLIADSATKTIKLCNEMHFAQALYEADVTAFTLECLCFQREMLVASKPNNAPFAVGGVVIPQNTGDKL